MLFFFFFVIGLGFFDDPEGEKLTNQCYVLQSKIVVWNFTLSVVAVKVRRAFIGLAMFAC